MVFDNLPTTYVSTNDLPATIDTYINELPLGYRLEMVKPADHPSEAWLSNGAGVVCLTERRVPFRSKKGGVHRAASPVIEMEWHTGRAGMEYRDLIPGRMDGRVIASHIRLTKGGEVADYVHYHKVDFQMIYCLRGRIRVVYEDQGPPFWLKPGDCVLQPPEIRHRVLECIAGSEVIEIGMPAVHETWVEHDIELPTAKMNPSREFEGQRFLRHIAAETKRIPSNTGGFLIRDTGMLTASRGFADVSNIRLLSDGKERPKIGGIYAGPFQFYYVLEGDLVVRLEGEDDVQLNADDCFMTPRLKPYWLDCSSDIELLRVVIKR